MADHRKLSIYIPDEALTPVRAWAQSNNRSMSYCVQQALLLWQTEGHPEQLITRAARKDKVGT